MRQKEIQNSKLSAELAELKRQFSSVHSLVLGQNPGSSRSSDLTGASAIEVNFEVNRPLCAVEGPPGFCALPLEGVKVVPDLTAQQGTSFPLRSPQEGASPYQNAVNTSTSSFSPSKPIQFRLPLDLNHHIVGEVCGLYGKALRACYPAASVAGPVSEERMRASFYLSSKGTASGTSVLEVLYIFESSLTQELTSSLDSFNCKAVYFH